MKEERGMKAHIDIDLEKYNDKKTENDYLDIDRHGVMWLCHEEDGVKFWKLASDKELKDWGFEKIETCFR